MFLPYLQLLVQFIHHVVSCNPKQITESDKRQVNESIMHASWMCHECVRWYRDLMPRALRQCGGTRARLWPRPWSAACASSLPPGTSQRFATLFSNTTQQQNMHSHQYCVHTSSMPALHICMSTSFALHVASLLALLLLPFCYLMWSTNTLLKLEFLRCVDGGKSCHANIRIPGAASA